MMDGSMAGAELCVRCCDSDGSTGLALFLVAGLCVLPWTAWCDKVADVYPGQA